MLVASVAGLAVTAIIRPPGMGGPLPQAGVVINDGLCPLWDAGLQGPHCRMQGPGSTGPSQGSLRGMPPAAQLPKKSKST